MSKNLFRNCRLLMLVGCLIPIVVLVVLLTSGFKGSGLSFLLILLCPLAHLLLMRDHGKDSEGHH